MASSPATARTAPDVLSRTLAAIAPLDPAAVADARARQKQLTKPQGALGALEEASVQLCGIQGACPPEPLDRPAVAVFAGDHGVHEQGVSPWPQEVTAGMIANFRAGGAAVNVLARQVGATVHVIDVGVVADLEPGDDLWSRKVRRATWDLAVGPAMTREEAVLALAHGIEVAETLVEQGHDCLLTGDMGIANTTPATALVCAFTGAEPATATGRGSGADDSGLALKRSVVAAALAARPPGDDPVDALASLGGFEHAALAGFVLGAAARRVPVVLDGVIAGAAALVAAALAPTAVQYCFAGHRSVEPGHTVALEALKLRPLVDLDLRLGEGSGAVLAFGLIRAAGAVLAEMATFDSAGVARKDRP
ncbi:MAG TPA: nicotinate-nucleotide--dimethylbenzimidazole phosphoribosyltransferase [Nocardioidaceae bacterium]|nr:nicotinate-nucleotide--dimethylbenzimidazole phosphoribosyltransferase [Nocardioidaceae bacterium]